MRSIEPQIIEAADALSVLRLSNTSLFGDGFPSGWLFRGHRKTDYELVPAVWRDEFVAKWLHRLPLIDRIVQEIETTAPKDSFVRIYHGDRLRRFREAYAALAIRKALLHNFLSIANELALSPIKPIGDPRDNLAGNPDALWQDEGPLPGEELAQHYGMETSLLDWTSDPLTALAFALEGEGETDALTVWAVNQRYIDANRHPAQHASSQTPWLSFCFGNRAEVPFLHAQHGAFTYIKWGHRQYVETGRYPRVDDLLSVYAPQCIKKFIIPVSGYEQFRLHLGLLHERRSKAHRMPDLPHCAEVAKDALHQNIVL